MPFFCPLASYLFFPFSFSFFLLPFWFLTIVWEQLWGWFINRCNSAGRILRSPQRPRKLECWMALPTLPGMQYLISTSTFNSRRGPWQKLSMHPSMRASKKKSGPGELNGDWQRAVLAARKEDASCWSWDFGSGGSGWLRPGCLEFASWPWVIIYKDARRFAVCMGANAIRDLKVVWRKSV